MCWRTTPVGFAHFRGRDAAGQQYEITIFLMLKGRIFGERISVICRRGQIFIIVMSKEVIEKSFGREAFGSDPAGYHSARPGYPDWVYDLVVERCGLRPGAAAFEVGAGTGLATQRLLDLGADPLIAIEPDLRLADFMKETIRKEGLSVIGSTFEQVTLPSASFDLGFCATAFHWLDEETALTKIARLLRPGGWWVMVWNVFGDSGRADPFHEATRLLLEGPVGPSRDDRNVPFALDKDARVAALKRNGNFDAVEHLASTWSLVLDAEQVSNLYATYSNIQIRPDRDKVLGELRRVAREEFQDRVTRNMTTSLYMARRI
jgi:ubiquinone/menaquinone biosynthesis C-methylase UbiE